MNSLGACLEESSQVKFDKHIKDLMKSQEFDDLEIQDFDKFPDDKLCFGLVYDTCLLENEEGEKNYVRQWVEWKHFEMELTETYKQRQAIHELIVPTSESTSLMHVLRAICIKCDK